MEVKWDVFEGKPNGRTRSRELRVTLGHGSTFYLNNVAYEALERPAAVELMYDGNRRIIGMRPIDPGRRNAFPVRPHTSERALQTNLGRAFCKHYRLRVRETMLFEKAELLDDGVPALPMDSVVTVGRGSR